MKPEPIVQRMQAYERFREEKLRLLQKINLTEEEQVKFRKISKFLEAKAEWYQSCCITISILI